MKRKVGNRTIYVSVVSHNQTSEIIKNFTKWTEYKEKYNISLVITDNTGCEELESFCKMREFKYRCNLRKRGFGENHNIAFEECSPTDEDLWIICNPDVLIDELQLQQILNSSADSNYDLMNFRCYYDMDKKIMSNPDRSVPGLLNFIVSILTGKRLHYGLDFDVREPGWISGEFMCIKPLAFKKLGGFDPMYFMYVEDVDLCLRARKQGCTLGHDSGSYIIHLTKMKSREIFNVNVLWHYISAIKFSIKHRRFGLVRSQVKTT